MAIPLFIILELVFLATAHWLGGPPWAVLGAIAVAVQAVAGARPARLTLLLPAVFGLGLFRATGNRELFFPYCMALAAFASLPLARRSVGAGVAAGGLPIAAFMAVRILQQAPARVLAVELAVAVPILALVVAAARRSRGGLPEDVAIVAAATMLACAGLAL